MTHFHCPDCGDSLPIDTELHRCRKTGQMRSFHERLKTDMALGLGRSIDQVTLGVNVPTTDTAKRCLDIARGALDLFVERNKKYGESAQRLGLAGQYADINRKVVLLEKWLWHGEEPEGDEGIIEVCEDLIGHLLLTIDMVREGGPKR